MDLPVVRTSPAPAGTPLWLKLIAIPVTVVVLLAGLWFFAGVELVVDGGGLRARSSGGEELPAHQAFWFAWSQFHPDTALWTGR